MSSTLESTVRCSLGSSLGLPAVVTPLGALFNCDCLRLLAAVATDSVDCVFADPPFNLGKDYGRGTGADELAERDYLAWSREWLTECCRVLSPGGALFVYNLPRWLIPLGAFLMERLQLRHWIALTMKSTYPRGVRLYPAHYGLLYFTKGPPRVFHRLRVPVPACRHCGGDLKDYGGHRGALNPAGLSLTDFWEDTSPVRHRKFKNRPANELKPMVPRRALEMSTDPFDLVLDPFGGGGSTYEAAELAGSHWLGSELGDCRPIAERLRPFATAGRLPEAVARVLG
ncbi:MAG: site-specific DNA-methyltransferase [Candidatus Riflebacteria bacterium]|nr:site-specific DNA-methyltransferase [Candidatus Riflebacteria bacterium]